MALKSTIYKVQLDVVNLDRHYYATHDLTVACHPSENERRLMIRIVAFAWFAHERLEFGKGVSDSDEPDLWLRDWDGQISLWVELGHPDEKTLVRACGRSQSVAVVTHSAQPHLWWDPMADRAARWSNLRVMAWDSDACTALEALAARSMDLQVTIQERELWVRDASGHEVHWIPRLLKE